MTTYSFGDVVVAKIKFSNFESEKPRPVIVISFENYHRRKPDIVVTSISSDTVCDADLGEFLIGDLSMAGLSVPSRAKAFISTIDPKIIKYKIGQLNNSDVIFLRAMLEKIICF